jgi:alkanesulfonate monooxygenase SsuD/methylene tetrahydromethanopterin reductase-like flavin-dependent oxidoreductase (luciferase family)
MKERTMPETQAPRFGIATAPQQVGYDDVLRVWKEADAIPEIEHAWLFDHLMPIGGDPNGPIFEGWTLLSALAAQTQRLRLGLLVTSNRFRPPAMLAKIAATVDVVSGGRLDFGIGVGSRPNPPAAWREYPAYGLPFRDFAHAVGSLAEACTVIRRLWTEDQPFDFDGTYIQLTGAFGNPKPVQRPCPPTQRAARPAVRGDRTRPRLDHPLDPPARRLRRRRLDPGRDRERGRRRLRAHRARAALPVSGARRPLGRRRADRRTELSCAGRGGGPSDGAS